jgi:hypothetical protein
MVAFLYVLHDAKLPRFKILAGFEPAFALNVWGVRYFDLKKSYLLGLKVPERALQLESALRKAIERGAKNSKDPYARNIAADAEWFPAICFDNLLKYLQKNQSAFDFEFVDLLAPPVSHAVVRVLPAAAPGAQFLPMPGDFLDGVESPYVGDRYLPISTANTLSPPKSAELAAFLGTLEAIRARCTFLALLPQNSGATGFAHQSKRCLVGVYPERSGAKTALMQLYNINTPQKPLPAVWEESKVAKVCLIGRHHLKDANEHGLVQCEIEFKDPLDAQPYLAYARYAEAGKPWLTLPPDKAWYVQNTASRRAHDLMRLPAGIPGWDVPLPDNIYFQLQTALQTPVKIVHARKGAPAVPSTPGADAAA